MRSRKRLAAGGVLSLALVAAACGGSNDTKGEAASTTAAGPTTTIEIKDAKTGTTLAAGQPKTMEEWEALWTKERAALVQKAKDNKWGKSADGKTLTGPDGFMIDLSKCPAGWSDTEGLTDTEIKAGETGAASGTLADSFSYHKAMHALFDYYSGAGVFKDSNGKTRKINYLHRDDAYDPAKTIPLVDELLDSQKVFYLETLGTPNTMKVYDKLNQRCVPNPYAITGHPAWNDPVNHPWTTGLALTYATEANLWGAFIENHIAEFPNKVKVGALIMNNDFGKVYNATFKQFLEQSEKLKGKVDYFSETIEPAAATVTNEMTTLASKNPDIFIMMLAGTACVQTVVEAAQNGLKAKTKYLFDDQPCGNNATMGKDKVGNDGTAAEGWWLVGSGAKDMTDPTLADDPWEKFVLEQLKAKGIDPKSSGNLNSGVFFAWPLIQAMRLAGELPGGLTRTNYVLAQRIMVMTNPTVPEGVKFTMSGNKDAYPIEGGIYQQYSVAKQAFEKKSAVIDLDGTSKPCAWNQATSSC